MGLIDTNQFYQQCEQNYKQKYTQSKSNCVRDLGLFYKEDITKFNNVNAQFNAANACIKGNIPLSPEIAQTIIEMDTDFKFNIKPLKKDLTLYRGIKPHYPDQIMKSMSINPGEITEFPEYSFFTTSEDVAKQFGPALLYEVHFPKGTRLSYNEFMYEFNAPRNSKYLCTEKIVVKNNNNNKITKIKMDYILPEGQKTKSRLKEIGRKLFGIIVKIPKYLRK